MAPAGSSPLLWCTTHASVYISADWVCVSSVLLSPLCLSVFQVVYLQQAEVNREKVSPMHQSSIDGVEDMSTLAELHEAAIMHNLHQRYQKDNIYVRNVQTFDLTMLHETYICLYATTKNTYVSWNKIIYRCTIIHVFQCLQVTCPVLLKTVNAS